MFLASTSDSTTLDNLAEMVDKTMVVAAPAMGGTVADHRGIIINVTKRLIGVTKWDFLGHHVVSIYVEIKVQVIRDFLHPSTLTSCECSLVL